MNRTGFAILSLFFCFALFGPGTAYAGVHKDEKLGFQISSPSRWQ